MEGFCRAGHIYQVSEKTEGFKEIFAPIVKEIRSKRTNMEKTIIFCRTYEQTSHIYLFFKYMLGQAATEAIGFPNISKFRIIDVCSQLVPQVMLKKPLSRHLLNLMEGLE